MHDILKYRFPGEKAFEKNGAFSELNSPKGYEGFIVSDFQQNKFYGFMEDAQPKIAGNKTPRPIVMTKEEYLHFGHQFLTELRSNGLGKAIFSRIKKVRFPIGAKDKLFTALCKEYPNALVYEIQSNFFGHWIGATPEVLLNGNKEVLETVALASTKKAEDNSAWGKKEMDEQAMVADFIEGCLQDTGSEFERSEREELKAGPVKHLINSFKIKNNPDPVRLVQVLHPTPAVSGLPRDAAIHLIERIEKHDRGLYTGFLGMIGDTFKLFVNLRCAQIVEDEVFLYVGGGYTRDSEVESEWEETENKARTLTRVIENL